MFLSFHLEFLPRQLLLLSHHHTFSLALLHAESSHNSGIHSCSTTPEEEEGVWVGFPLDFRHCHFFRTMEQHVVNLENNTRTISGPRVINSLLLLKTSTNSLTNRQVMRIRKWSNSGYYYGLDVLHTGNSQTHLIHQVVALVWIIISSQK